MGKIDLHIHTTASDGRYTPAEIVRMAAQRGLTVIAITDHDTVDGIAPALSAARDFPHLTVIPGVEISTDSGGETHILGYFIDYTSELLKAELAKSRDSRQVRAQKMILRLRELGIDIDWDRVREIAGSGSIGRPHIAQAMLEKGYISSVHEAFEKYISHDKPAYVSREKMSPQEAVKLVLASNGLPALAHPFTVADHEALVARLSAAGMVALEAYYGGSNEKQVAAMVTLAQKYGLIATGGSDYHGLEESAETTLGGVDVPPHPVSRLMALAREKSRGR